MKKKMKILTILMVSALMCSCAKRSRQQAFILMSEDVEAVSEVPGSDYRYIVRKEDSSVWIYDCADVYREDPVTGKYKIMESFNGE